MKSKKVVLNFVKTLFRFMFLAGLSVIIVYPFFYSLSVALRDVQDLYDPLVILVPRHFTLDNIRNVMERMDYGRSLLGSFFRDGVSCLLQIASCSLTGYGLARFNFKGKKIISALMFAIIIVPPQTYVIPNYIEFRYFNPFGFSSLVSLISGNDININLIDSNLAFFLHAVLGLGIRSGIIIFMFRQFFRGMPKELEEAAYIDGLSFFRTYYRIMLPNSKASLVTSFLLSFVWYWNDYVYTSSLMPRAKTVMNQLSILFNNISYIMQYEQNSNPYEGILLLQSGVLLSIIPVLILYLVFQRQFTQSIERSGIVG